jgi:hypothetical protein
MTSVHGNYDSKSGQITVNDCRFGYPRRADLCSVQNSIFRSSLLIRLATWNSTGGYSYHVIVSSFPFRIEQKAVERRSHERPARLSF